MCNCVCKKDFGGKLIESKRKGTPYRCFSCESENVRFIDDGIQDGLHYGAFVCQECGHRKAAKVNRVKGKKPKRFLRV